MKKLYSAILPLLTLLFVLSSFTVAQETAENPLPTYDDISWLAGKWQGEGFGGICQEIWEKEAGGTMTGTFKLIVNDKIAFYELMVIDLAAEKPALILKHFNPDMTGWEEKDKVITFPFESYSENELIFDGLTYKKTGDNSLRISVRIKESEGEAGWTDIDCTRMK